jgi:hypothetical protein
MATAEKNFIAIRRKLDFSDRREKKLNAIRFSLARARVSKLQVGTVRLGLRPSMAFPDHARSYEFSAIKLE